MRSTMRTVLLAALLFAGMAGRPAWSQDTDEPERTSEPAPASDTARTSDYAALAKAYADAMLAEGRDRYGGVHAPVFATMLDRQTMRLLDDPERTVPFTREEVGVRAIDRSWNAANPDNDAGLHELLYRLSEDTGDAHYAQAADHSLGWFLENTQHGETGLLAWGEHTAWRLDEERPTRHPDNAWSDLKHEFHAGWMVWPELFRLDAERATRYADGMWRCHVYDEEAGLHAHQVRYDTCAPDEGFVFPRVAGTLAYVGALAYAHAGDEATRDRLLRRIDRLAQTENARRNARSGALYRLHPHEGNEYAVGSDLEGVLEVERALEAAPGLPDSTRARLVAWQRQSDATLLEVLANRSDTLGYAHRTDQATLQPTLHIGGNLWCSRYGVVFPLASAARKVAARYRQTGHAGYRAYVLWAADRYAGAEPACEAYPLWPGALADAIGLLLDAHALTADVRYLQEADRLGRRAVDLFLDDTSPLPKVFSRGFDHYEALSGGADLMLAFYELGQALEGRTSGPTGASGVGLSEGAPTSDSVEVGRPVLAERVAVPDPLLHPDGYMGDLRMGDLDGDGAVEFVLYRSVGGGMKPSFLAAFDAEGEVLWQAGKGGEQPARPGAVTVYDLDGDGRDEVVHFFAAEGRTSGVADSCMADVRIQVRDGQTGEVLREAATPALKAACGEGANWVHQRILAADLQGNGRPADFVVKLGTTLLAFDDRLETLWTYDIAWRQYGRHSAYTPAVGDLDGDGRDEVFGGYYLLEGDGRPVWEGEIARHMDSVVIAEWDGGETRAIGSGFGHVLDARGKVVLRLGEADVPHGQEVRVADFLAHEPGPEMMIRQRGHEPDVITVGTDGRVLHRFRLNDSPNHTGMEAVYWDGLDEPALLYNGGVLWRGDGRRFAALPGLPAPVGEERMGWYHAIPADVRGDGREEVVVYNPWDRHVWIYSPAPVRTSAFEGYVAGPRQYNVRLMD